jgi:hypothetical protein
MIWGGDRVTKRSLARMVSWPGSRLTIIGALAAGGVTFMTSIPAQTQAARAKFEVASVKLNSSGSNGSGENIRRGRVNVTNDTVKELIQLAFGVKDFQIVGGPGWLGTAL